MGGSFAVIRIDCARTPFTMVRGVLILSNHRQNTIREIKHIYFTNNYKNVITNRKKAIGGKYQYLMRKNKRESRIYDEKGLFKAVDTI